MFYIAKFLQASGLGIILVGFLSSFPTLMDRTLLGVGIGVFFGGWLLQNYGLKK